MQIWPLRYLAVPLQYGMPVEPLRLIWTLSITRRRRFDISLFSVTLICSKIRRRRIFLPDLKFLRPSERSRLIGPKERDWRTDRRTAAILNTGPLKRALCNKQTPTISCTTWQKEFASYENKSVAPRESRTTDAFHTRNLATVQRFQKPADTVTAAWFTTVIYVPWSSEVGCNLYSSYSCWIGCDYCESCHSDDSSRRFIITYWLWWHWTCGTKYYCKRNYSLFCISPLIYAEKFDENRDMSTFSVTYYSKRTNMTCEWSINSFEELTEHGGTLAPADRSYRPHVATGSCTCPLVLGNKPFETIGIRFLRLSLDTCLRMVV